VDALRAPDGPWAALLGHTLEPVALDALVCALAPELEPRLGWAFQGLQPGATQPWASRALVQELLALDASQAEWLRRALAPEAPLRRLGWLRLEADDPYQPLRAAPALLARVCGRPAEPTPPPGASPVPGHAGWDDLVLPASRLAMLQEFLLWITQRETVVGRWGGRATGGPVALFAGPRAPARPWPPASSPAPWAGACTGWTWAAWSASTWARPSRTSTACSTPPRARPWCCSSTRPMRCSPSAAR
jgi:hypothetical protein